MTTELSEKEFWSTLQHFFLIVDYHCTNKIMDSKDLNCIKISWWSKENNEDQTTPEEISYNLFFPYKSIAYK